MLPQHVDHVTGILNVTDQLNIDRAGDFSRRHPTDSAQNTAGRPQEYDLAGYVPAVRDPTGFLWFSSTASETFEINVTGYAASSSGTSGTGLATTLQTETVNAAGVSPVTLSTLFTEIHSIGKATHTNGDYWFFDAAAADAAVSWIPAGEFEAKFRRIELQFIPSADKTLRISYRRRIPTLTNDNQSPHASVDADFVVERAVALWQRHQEQYSKAQWHDQQAERILAAEADEESNFGEPHSRIIPYLPYADDPYSDHYRGDI